jgi:diketogulonate reductase-like aldo/keto reductase
MRGKNASCETVHRLSREYGGGEVYNTENELGLAIQESRIPRSDIFLTTKANSLDDVEAGLKASLARLRTDYVDLYETFEPSSSRCIR